MKDAKNIILFGLIFGLIGGILGSIIILNFVPKGFDDVVTDWYSGETAVHVSPHHIRKAMAKGDDSFILVDLRSQVEYEEEHIRGAISIPAYKDRDNSDYGAKERIVSTFSQLPDDKDIIVYCYSIPCMTGRKIGKMLADNGIYVQQLGVGWNEWRYHWTLWNHAHEWNITDVQDYIWSGSDPGAPINKNLSGETCPIEGGFGC